MEWIWNIIEKTCNAVMELRRMWDETLNRTDKILDWQRELIRFWIGNQNQEESGTDKFYLRLSLRKQILKQEGSGMELDYHKICHGTGKNLR